MKFELRKTDKAGGAIYAAAGIRASLYANKSLFADGKPPASIEVTIAEGDGAFVEPGAVKPVVSSAEAIEKAKVAAEKATAAAQKAADRAAKAVARAAKLVPATTETTETAAE